MQKHLCLGVAALALMIASSARSGQITNLQLYDGSAAPTATIYFTNADGTGSNTEYVYADPQVSGGTTAPAFYCVDLWHDNVNGQTYPITQVPGLAFPNTSTFADPDNRIGWLLSQDQSTPDARAAVQLAIWYTIDSEGFSMGTSDSTITNDYSTLIGFAGYNSAVNYSADFWLANHDSSNTLYQDLVSDPPGGVVTNASVPEPGSVVLASVSGFFLAVLHLWRRIA
jgi:Thioester domain